MAKPQQVTKDGAVYWRIQIRRKKLPRPIDEYFNSKAEAQQRIDQINKALEDEAETIPGLPMENLSFGEALRRFLKDPKARRVRQPKTNRIEYKPSYLKDRKQRLEFLGRVPNRLATGKRDRTGGGLGPIELKTIKTSYLKTKLNLLENELEWSPATKSRYESALTSLFDYCTDPSRYWMDQNPVNWKRVSASNRRERKFTNEEWQRLLAAADAQDQIAKLGYLGFWLRLARWSGMRKSELLELKWSQLKLEADFGPDIVASLSLHDTKNSEPRVVFLDITTLRLIQAHEQRYRRQDNPLIFHSDNQNPTQRYSVSNAFVKARQAAGLDGLDDVYNEPLVIHSIRHTWAMEMASADGQTEADLMSAAGWKTLQTANSYIRRSSRGSANATQRTIVARRKKTKTYPDE